MNKELRELLAGYVDNELNAEERLAFDKELAENPELRAELEQFQSLKEVTGLIKYADLPDEVWENYWQSIYRKLERGIGWIMFSIGAIILVCYAAYEFFENLLLDQSIPMIIKVGVVATSGGLAFLLISFTRERLFAYKRDRYGEVKK